MLNYQMFPCQKWKDTLTYKSNKPETIKAIFGFQISVKERWYHSVHLYQTMVLKMSRNVWIFGATMLTECLLCWTLWQKKTQNLQVTVVWFHQLYVHWFSLVTVSPACELIVSFSAQKHQQEFCNFRSLLYENNYLSPYLLVHWYQNDAASGLKTLVKSCLDAWVELLKLRFSPNV